PSQWEPTSAGKSCHVATFKINIVRITLLLIRNKTAANHLLRLLHHLGEDSGDGAIVLYDGDGFARNGIFLFLADAGFARGGETRSHAHGIRAESERRRHASPFSHLSRNDRNRSGSGYHRGQQCEDLRGLTLDDKGICARFDRGLGGGNRGDLHPDSNST